jgi:integrase
MLSLDDLTTGIFARYRDDRLLQVGPQKVTHELNTLSVVLRTAQLDWDIPLRRSPLDGLRKPRLPPGRDRRLASGELERIRDAALCGNTPYLWPVIEFAIETAMRKAEILALEWGQVRWGQRIAHLPDTKNGLPRDVPLTRRALEILQMQKNQGQKCPFPHSIPAVRHAWNTVVGQATISDLHFHDLRHEAISRFFEAGLSIPEVAKITGHKDFRMLARYTHIKAENIVIRFSGLEM